MFATRILKNSAFKKLQILKHNINYELAFHDAKSDANRYGRGLLVLEFYKCIVKYFYEAIKNYDDMILHTSKTLMRDLRVRPLGGFPSTS
jgi:hypothetical protein